MIAYALRDRVAVITIDNPPVNALAPGVVEGIDECLTRAEADPDVLAAVLIGAGSTFVAGADIRVFDTILTRQDSIERSRAIHARFRRIEDCRKPVVAAIHGHALGGGLELAMACHWRIAAAGARVGQPEVLLGIIPGAGGTQRLPRLCGQALAEEMCSTGLPVTAERALRAGILDEVVHGDLLTEAVRFARAKAASRVIRRTRDRVLSGAAVSFDEGCEREIELFADRVLSRESQALRHVFFAEREVAKVNGVSRQTPVRPIRRAAVIGAGTMGGGIAMCYANAGIPVLLHDVDGAALERRLAIIRGNYHKLTEEERSARIALIQPVAGWDGFGDVDIVVEAAFEDFELKRELFTRLGQITQPGCLLASNTSTLDIDAFAQASGRPEDVLGHHFFSPANVMKLLEIVRGAATSPEALATSLALAKRLGKVGVVVGNCFGFVANRMLAYYLREAHLMLEEGATVRQIDRVMTEFGFRVGPFVMQDIAGLDVGARIRRHLAATGRTRAEGPQSEIPDLLYQSGRYGQKTGAGWYRYEAGSRLPLEDPLIETLADQAAAARGISRRPIADEEIVNRITAALANEGWNILGEGIAQRSGEIDVIYIHGFGFPRHRGGPMFYAATLGLGSC